MEKLNGLIRSVEEHGGHDFHKLTSNWHDGQWSGFYRYQCNGGTILNRDHAWDCRREASRNLASMGQNHLDYDCMLAFYEIVDEVCDILDASELAEV